MHTEPEHRYTHIARKLVFARIARNWTQGEVAEQLGVALDTIHSWESGRRMPTALKLELWALALGYDLDIVPRTEESTAS